MPLAYVSPPPTMNDLDQTYPKEKISEAVSARRRMTMTADSSNVEPVPHVLVMHDVQGCGATASKLYRPSRRSLRQASTASSSYHLPRYSVICASAASMPSPVR